MGKQFADVGSQYGAQMGRRETFTVTGEPVTLFRIDLVDGDYDDGGAYWGGPPEGAGSDLWCARGDGEAFARAKTEACARIAFQERFPGITFAELEGLEGMTSAYVDAMLWSSVSGDITDDHTSADLADGARETCRETCRAFLLAHRDDIGGAYEQAGHDLWLTSNGHGVGFGDREHIYGAEQAERLDNAAQSVSGGDPYVGDNGKVYL